jgi:uncharacterized protein (DUF433 family)
MVLASDIGSMLESDPAYWGGRPFVRGKRVTVHRIAIAHKQGMSPADIATDYDLELAEVYAALAHYFAHQDGIDADIEAYDAESDQIARAMDGGQANR